MKRLLIFPVLILFLCGCAGHASESNNILALRDRLINSNGCSFIAVIAADYGEQTYSFQLSCKSDTNGKLKFEVIDPESISGITGSISDKGGELTFDDRALVFQLLADGQISPVTAPWLFLRGLRGGYIASSGKDEAYIRVDIDDSFAGKTLHQEVWLDHSGKPVRGEIIWDGVRILTIDIRDFVLL